ncbi:MAG: mechanosensitive ion channel [Deltaproteobacteria bacterium]|nr:mechanosensitive ion channel [Candidatus Zymogenaceae bacterium]
MTSLSNFMSQVYFGNTVDRYLYFFLIVIGAAVLARMIYYLFKNGARKMAKKTKTSLDDVIIDFVEEPITLLFLVGGVYLALKILVMTPPVNKFVGQVIIIVFLVAVTWLVTRMFDVLVEAFLRPLASKTETKLDDQIIPIISAMVKVSIWVMVIIVLLSEMGYDVLSLITGLGVGGAAIAIAAKESLGQMFGGFNIFMNKPYQMDDTIVYKGIEGKVEEVGLRMTTMRTFEDTRVMIPNSEISNSLMENLSARRARRALLYLAVAPETNAETLQHCSDLVTKALDKTPGVRKGSSCDLYDFVSYSITFRVVYWIEDIPQYFSLRHSANTAIKKALEEAGVRLASPIARV